MQESKGAISGRQRKRRFLFLAVAASAIVYGIAGAVYAASLIQWFGLLPFALALGGIGGGIAGAVGGAAGARIALSLTEKSDGHPGRALAQGGFAAAAVAFAAELFMATLYSGSIALALKFASAGLLAAVIAGSGWYLFRRLVRSGPASF